ncbi:uncharacterized protein LOC117326014 [Pecten maximus]|uniref:uncharacterized protein LOC117326014 n=1 Tax=Pecten maximus TaxID=6579 RepID=UPI001458A812|nr:uncharacterized protein LOC117326014 [Pecten maximus]
MAVGGLPALKWTENVYSISEIIHNPDFELPMLVKVEEGICSDNDSETFSRDDLLKFDSVKSIPKVVACCVDYRGRRNTTDTLREDAYGYVQRSMDLTIPLRYNGVVKIYHPEAGVKVYNSVSELIRDHPRFVQAVDDFVTSDNVKVNSNSTIEVLRCIPGKGLVGCVIEDDQRHLEMDSHATCKLRLLPDNTEYTLQEITRRFAFPQYVTFQKESGLNLETSNIQEAIEHSRIFEGTVKIMSRIEQKTMIGHYKPPEVEATNDTYRCQRTLVIIPLDSPTAKDIEVRVSLNAQDDDDYELVMARNFSTRNAVNEENIDGTIYMDFLKTPKPTFVDYEEIESVPPRRANGNENNSKISPPRRPPPPPRPTRPHRPQKQ